MAAEELTFEQGWAHMQRAVEGHEQDGESVFDGTDLGAINAVQKFIDEHKGKMALTAEEVQVAYGVLCAEDRTGVLTDREQQLCERMELMLGCTADGGRR